MLTSRVFFILSRISLMLCKSVNIVSSKRAQGIMYGKVFFFFYGLGFSTRKADRWQRTWTQKYRASVACEGELEEAGRH